MNEQRDRFKTALLRDVISRVLGGGTPSRSVAAFWGGDIPWASVKDFADGKAVIYDSQEHITERGLASSATNIARSNSVVVCTRIAVGRAALCGRDIAINQDVKALYPNEKLSPEYLLLLLKHYQPLLESKAIGSTVKGISTDELLDLRISFPNRFEQTQIAAVLSCIDRAIEHTEALIAKQQRIKTGLMQDLLTKGIDEHGNIRAEATHEFKDSPLGRIPKEWEVVKLMEKITLPSGQVDPKQERYCDLPLIAPDHIEQATGKLLNLQTAREQNAISGKYLFQAGDVIYSKIRPYLRKAVLATVIQFSEKCLEVLRLTTVERQSGDRQQRC